MATRRERQARKRRTQQGGVQAAPVQQRVPKQRHGIDAFYHDKYLLLLLIPFLLLILALAQIGYQAATTGDFLNKGVSLKGGLTITVPVHGDGADPELLEERLRLLYPENDLNLRGISELGDLRAISVEVAVATDDQEEIRALEQGVVAHLAEDLPHAEEEYAVEIIGPSLGQAFFSQTLKAVAIAFLLMGMVVFLYFGHHTKAKTAGTVTSIVASILVFQANGPVLWALAILLSLGLIILYIKYSPPSAAVILAAFSNIVMTLAVVNLLGIQISTAGIAALLMLIGYSVDTDILLSTRVLKRTKGSIYERIISSLKTGMTMSLTSFAAATIGYFVSQSAVIKQIMLIILIGLLADIINTWLQNAGIIRWYAERRRGA